MSTTLLTPAEWHKLADRQMRLALKDILTEEDKADLRHLGEALVSPKHPILMRLDELIDLDLSEYPEWVPQYIKERGWEWAWFATEFGETLEEHVKSCALNSSSGKPSLSARVIEHVNHTLPYPNGWVPESRRMSEPE